MTSLLISKYLLHFILAVTIQHWLPTHDKSNEEINLFERHSAVPIDLDILWKVDQEPFL